MKLFHERDWERFPRALKSVLLIKSNLTSIAFLGTR